MSQKLSFSGFLIVLLALSACIAFSSKLSAQSTTVKILGGNTVNGIVQGAVMGGASMALADDDDFAPLRIGVGSGILYGVGTGIYDIYESKNGTLLVSGTFNNGDVTTIIVLLDTIYGAAAGSLLASAVLLIANEPLVDALQYGSGAGAWVGFGFGLFDAFVLSERTAGPVTASSYNSSVPSGLLTIDSNKSLSVGLIEPVIFNSYDFEYGQLNKTRDFGINLMNVNIKF